MIRDSAGKLLPYAIWSPLLGTGEYLISRERDAEGREYGLLRRLSREEREKAASHYRPMESDNFSKGQQLDFVARGLDGVLYSLKALRGKIVVLHFTCISCDNSAVQLAQYNELVDSFGTDGRVVFLALASDAAVAVKKALGITPFRFSVIPAQSTLFDSLQVHVYPQDLILDKEGKVYIHIYGLGNGTIIWLRRGIKTLLAQGI